MDELNARQTEPDTFFQNEHSLFHYSLHSGILRKILGSREICWAISPSIIQPTPIISVPEFGDLIAASLRRIAGLAGMPRSAEYGDLMRAAKSAASQTTAQPWVGEKCNLVRWSAAQQREVELFGITGEVSLPNGPGFIWPLLAAAQWCHIGKGTVFGMGQIRIQPYHRDE